MWKRTLARVLLRFLSLSVFLPPGYRIRQKQQERDSRPRKATSCALLIDSFDVISFKQGRRWFCWHSHQDSEALRFWQRSLLFRVSLCFSAPQYYRNTSVWYDFIKSTNPIRALTRCFDRAVSSSFGNRRTISLKLVDFYYYLIC